MGARHSRAITVLVAEDSDLDYSLLEHALDHCGAQATINRAVDGLEALDYLKGEGRFADRTRYPFPNVVLLDLKMPRFSGFDVLEWLRANPRYRVIPTVVMSTSGEPSDVQRAYELGANTYFTKPAEIEELMNLCVHLAEYWGRAEIPARRH